MMPKLSHEITTIVPQLITLTVDPKTILYKRCLFSFFLLYSGFSCLCIWKILKGIVRFGAWGLKEPQQKVLKCCIYQTIWRPTKFYICFKVLVTVMPFSFRSLGPLIWEQSQVLILHHLMLIYASTMARLESFIEKMCCTLSVIFLK